MYFKDITDLNTLADKIILASDGTNLTIKYSDDDSVILDNYFTDSDHSVKTLQTAFGATISLKTFIDNYNRNGDGSNPRNFAVTGSGVINGTDKNNEILGNEENNTINGLGGDDIIYGGKGDDTITGGTGTNKIVFAQNFGSDTVNLTQTENLTLDLSALRLNEDDITYSYDGDNLLITTSQGTISLVNFVSEDVTNDGQGNAGSVNLKLSEITTIDLRNKNYTIDAQRTKNGTWHKETIDASEVDRYTYQEPYRSGRRTLYRTVATDVGVSIDGGAGNDTLTGSAWNDTIVGGAGNDTIYGGDGNDTIYGDENPTTILPDGYINGSNIIYGGEGNDTIYGGNGDDEITGGEGDDIIRGGNGNNTIIYNTNNDGSDTIYSSGGTDILQFNNLSSINDLTFARWGTNLIVKYSENGLITVDNYFLKNEEHDYDIDSGHSVKKVKIGNVETVIKTYLEDEEHPERLAITGQGLIEGSDTKNDYILGSNANDDLYGYGGNDTIDAGLGNNNIYLRSNSDEITSGHDKIKDGGGTDTIIFDNSVELEDLNFSFVGEIEGKKDLKISYGDNSVTIKDFQTGDYSVRYFEVGNTTYEINDFLTDKYGSNKNDNFMSTNADENFVLNKGNDTVTFGASFGQDTITSTQETDETGKVKNTDTLIFQDHSIATDNLDVSYNRNDVGVTDGIMIVARNTNEDQESGRVVYNGIISNDTPNLVIKDSANRTWDVNSYNNETSLDWSGDNKNRVAFIQGESGTNTIISNTGHNVINTSSGIGANGTSEDYGASLNYTYKGGHDRVKSESISDDTYNIDVFSSQTALSIKDAGGDDQYNIKTNAANIRFLFNVKNADYEGSYESFEDESWDQSSLFMIHRDKYNTQTIMDYIMGKEEKSYSEGIVTIKLASQAPDAVFSVTEDIRHMHTVDFTDDIDLTKWFEGIDSRVLSWISEHNFASTIHALDSITNACEHSQDEEGQPLVFEEWLNEHNFELTSNQTQHSLGNILINQLLDIYRDASYQAIVFNGGDGDDTIVGSINSDDITGGSGNNRIVFNGENFGVDTVNLTETENLTLDLTEYNFNKNDISFSYSGSDLVVTTPNGSIRLNNFASTNVVGENGNVKILLKDAVLNEETGAEILPAVLVDLKTENIVIQAERTTSGTWHNEIIDASEVDR
ncbi:hypothetical protein IJF81_03380, partial [bacterium]|nr:hypothetical protein [bacterium]